MVVSIYMQEFRIVGSSLVTVFNWLMGGVDLKIFNGTHNPETGLVLPAAVLVCDVNGAAQLPHRYHGRRLL